MSTKQAAVFGIFRPGNEVSVVMDKLLSTGFLNSKIKLLYPTIGGEVDIECLQKTMIVYFAKIGAYVGAVVFLIVGLVVVFGLVNIEFPVNIGFLNKAYVLMFIVLFGVFIGATSGTLVGIGKPQPIVLRFVSYIDAGATLLSVQVESLDEEISVKKSFESCGGRDIARLVEKQTWKWVLKSI
jgi:hypothetical protein